MQQKCVLYVGVDPLKVHTPQVWTLTTNWLIMNLVICVLRFWLHGHYLGGQNYCAVISLEPFLIMFTAADMKSDG